MFLFHLYFGVVAVLSMLLLAGLAWWNELATRTDLADANRLPDRRSRRAEHSGGKGLRRFVRAPLEGKELFHGHAQLTREMQGNLGIGHVCPGFDGVDRLPADAHAARQIGRSDSPALSNPGQPIFHLRFRHDYFLN